MQTPQCCSSYPSGSVARGVCWEGKIPSVPAYILRPCKRIHPCKASYGGTDDSSRTRAVGCPDPSSASILRRYIGDTSTLVNCIWYDLICSASFVVASYLFLRCRNFLCNLPILRNARYIALNCTPSKEIPYVHHNGSNTA